MKIIELSLKGKAIGSLQAGCRNKIMQSEIENIVKSISRDTVIFYPTEQEIERKKITASAQVRKFLKYAGINDFARQRRSNFKEREVQTYELTEQVIKRVRVKFVSGAAGPERHEWFWPVNHYTQYDSGDICSLISYFDSLVLVNYSKISPQKVLEYLRKLGLIQVKGRSLVATPNKLVSQYERINFSINKYISSGRFKERELYLDFESNFIANVAPLAEIEPHEFEKKVLVSATNELNFTKPDPFIDLVNKSQRWKHRNYSYFPPTTTFLAALSITAENMGSDESYSGNNFYDRLLSLMQIDDLERQQKIRDNFKHTVCLWDDFNSWLIKYDGQYGTPTAYPIIKHWKYVSYGMSQALVRTGDKQHIKKYLEDHALKLATRDLYTLLEEYLTSSSAHKYLSIIWDVRHLRPKIVEAAQQQLNVYNFTGEKSEKYIPLSLRLQSKSFPKKSFHPSLVCHTDTEIQHEVHVVGSASTVPFKDRNLVTLSPIGDGISVLGPPTNIDINKLLVSNLQIQSSGNHKLSYIYKSRPVMALVEVEPGVFEQTNRPEIFKKHIIFAQRALRKKVESFLNYCADKNFKVIEEHRSISSDFIIFENVIFGKTVSKDEMSGNNDPNYWIRPIETMSEIDILGGLNLGRNIYHNSSNIEFLISTDKQDFNVNLYLGDSASSFSQRVSVVNGIGSFQLSDFENNSFKEEFERRKVDPENFHGQDVRIEIDLPNYNSCSFSFRSSADAQYETDNQFVYNANPKNSFGFMSVEKTNDLENSISGLNTFSLTEVNPEGRQNNIRNFSADYSLDETDDDVAYLSEDISKIEKNCTLRGYHIWNCDAHDRFGICSDCGEYREFPKPKRANDKVKEVKYTNNNRQFKVVRFESKYSVSDIVDAIFYLQDFSWERFRKICSVISDDILFSNELLRALVSIGCIDVMLDEQTLKFKKLFVTPPTLNKIGDKYILVGFNSPLLVDALEKISGRVKKFEIGKIIGDISITLASFDGISIENNMSEVTRISDQFDRPLKIVKNVGSEIINSLPNMRQIYSTLRPTSVDLSGLEKFNPRSGKWEMTSSIEKDGGYRQRWPNHTYLIRTRGDFYQCTYESAKLFAADFEGLRLHKYNDETGEIIGQIGCDLPILFQRALVSFSGKLPKRSGIKELIFENVSPKDADVFMNKIYGQI